MILLTAFKDTSSEKLGKRLQCGDILILENHKEKSVEQLIGRLNHIPYDKNISDFDAFTEKIKLLINELGEQNGQN